MLIGFDWWLWYGFQCFPSLNFGLKCRFFSLICLSGTQLEMGRKDERMVFCYQNCSDLLWEKIVLVIEKNFWNWIFKIFEITRTIYSNSQRSEQSLVTECFLTCSWRFLRSNKLEQLEFKLEKIIGI